MQNNGDDNKAPPLWDGGEGAAKKTLRKPHVSLSVDAKEFIPKNYIAAVPSQAPYSAQDRLKQFKVEVNNDSKNDLDELNDIIKAVICDPGQFEEVVDDYMNIFNMYLNDEAMIASVAESIFLQGIQQPGFRYNGARLCSVILENCISFNAHMHKLCDKELMENTAKPGLTLFLAELYMQMDLDEVYPNCLYKSIDNLLIAGGDDNVKTACQTLKLSGRTLDAYDKDKMVAVFQKLDTAKFSVMNNIINLIESVINLRQNNWGQNNPPTCSSSHNGPNWNWLPPIVEKPTFYGPDGVELSMDEQKFLAKECCDYTDEFDDPDELCDPEPEMDEEIQAAFREFVKLSK
ncbi:PREDICTED: uncharacterized protein LOC108565763 [Nicrophorus vespilloides]|uniref:Uncharacterized protein LOC108565763 n=1 Tax=Nicrophorus vespilloides TaxID=110193 RepID=A0ABM1N205_NICVS|nr:PREDICTED: uncharacterized protein LOC108565763 [Nicrophorus vespilloides]